MPPTQTTRTAAAQNRPTGTGVLAELIYVLEEWKTHLDAGSSSRGQIPDIACRIVG